MASRFALLAAAQRRAAGTDSQTAACTWGHLEAAMWMPMPVPQNARARSNFFFGDLRAEREADAVVHGGALGVGRQVGNGPAALFEVCFDGFLEGVPGEVGADDDVFVFNCQHGSVLSGVCAGR